MGQFSNGGTNVFVAGGLQSSYSIPAVAAVLPLDELSKQLEEARQRVITATARLAAVASALYGEQPSSGQTEGKAIGRSGKIGSLNDQAEYIANCLTELETQINRLVTPLGG